MFKGWEMFVDYMDIVAIISSYSKRSRRVGRLRF